MDENPYKALRVREAKKAKRWDYRSTLVARWGAISVVFLAVALVGAVVLFCYLVTHLWPGTGTPDVVFPVAVAALCAWTGGAFLLAWLFRK